jgi:puromycin-sensitive aminopeptidase
LVRPNGPAEAANYHESVTFAPESRSDLDPFRLPRHVLPRRYEVHLEPDLGAATFAGRVLIETTVTR